MYRGIKKIAAIGLLFIFNALCAGCGKPSEDVDSMKETKKQEEDVVYVADYRTIEGSQYITTNCIFENIMYYIGRNYDETTQTTENTVYAMNVDTGEITALDIHLNLVSADAFVANMAADSKGNLAMVIRDYLERTDVEEPAVDVYTLRVISPQDGSIIMEKEISDILNQEESKTISYIMVDSDDNIYLSNGDRKVWVFDKSGEQKTTIELDKLTGVLGGMGISSKGTAVYACLGQSVGKLELWTMDMKSKKSGEKCENFQITMDNGPLCRIAPGHENEFYISYGQNVYKYDLETQTMSPKLNWIESNVSFENIKFFAALGDGRLVAMTETYTEDKTITEIVTLTPVSRDELTEKEEIVLGVTLSTSEINEAVVDFNKNSAQYVISVKEYCKDDFEAGKEEFINDIMLGKGPDIFDISGLDIDKGQLEGKGFIEDLTPYIDGDEEISTEDFFQNVLDMYTIDGKLCAIPNAFAITTLVGKTSQVGEIPGWTLDEMMKTIQQNSDVEDIYLGATKESILRYYIAFNADRYIDWSKGECFFDTEDFAKVLEFTNSFKKEYINDPNALSEVTKIHNGEQLFMLCSLTNMLDYQELEFAFQEPFTFIGFPVTSGNGSAISVENAFTINAGSQNKEGAWQFLKYFITPEAYEKKSDISSGFPTLKSAYNIKMKNAMTQEYYIDENGEEKEIPKMTIDYGDAYAEYFSATKDEVDEVTKLVESTTISTQWNDQLVNIVLEEATPFFEGQKSAKEAAEIIQNRVQVYINESR